MPHGYRSLVRQTLHYFARPHTGVLTQPVHAAAAWRASDFGRQDDYRETLNSEQVGEIERAVALARATGKSLRELSRQDFPLPRLSRRIGYWQREIDAGRGFVLLSGIPVERWEQRDAELFFWCFGLHLGIPGAQNPEGDLLGHVTDYGETKPGDQIRQYRTTQHIPFHCDAADVVGLLCLRAAKQGGESCIASSLSVYNEILRRRPELAQELYRPFLLDTRSEGGLEYFPVPPCRYAAGRLRTFYHAEYFRSVERHPAAPRLSQRQRELLDLYDEIANSPEYRLDMQFRPGDVQLLSNHVVVHSRTHYQDHPEPERRRHLLRLWLSLPQASAPVLRLRREISRLGLLADLARARLSQRRSAPG